MRHTSLWISVMAGAVCTLSSTAWTQDVSSEDWDPPRQFALVMDGPIAVGDTGLSADLYDLASGVLVGRTVRDGAGCLSFGTPQPVEILPPCPSPPELLPGQFYYEEEVTLELPGGTIHGTQRGWEAYNSKPPSHGGDVSAGALEKAEIDGGTGRFANARGEIVSRISDEHITVDLFGFQVRFPFWIEHSVVLVNLTEVTWAPGNSQSSNAQRFGVVMRGPATYDEGGMHVDLYAIADGAPMGQATFWLECIDGAGVAGAPPCDPSAELLPGQFQYRDRVRFDLPNGTIEGEWTGWSVLNSKLAENGGSLVSSVTEDGTMTGGTGQYANISGALHSRAVSELGPFGPVFVDRGVVFFDAH